MLSVDRRAEQLLALLREQDPRQLLSQSLNTKSGGEIQTPFYIVVLASFRSVIG